MPVDNWQSRILDGCATFFSGGTPSKSRAEFWTGTIPWVSAKDLKVFRLHDAEDHVTAEAIDAGSRVARAGSTFLLVRGMTLHNDVPICVAMRDMAFNQDIKALQPKPGVDGSFLTYWLLAHKRTLLGSVDFAGHGTGRLNTDTLKAMPVALPPLPEQKAIAAVLGALDDKIELNRRMNATLEAMARALFQSWFVDFDPVRAKLDGRQPTGLDHATAALFPNEFEDSDLGHIPKGWEVKTIEEIAERVAMGPFGSDIKVSTFVPEGIPVISGQHLRGTLLDDSEFNFVSLEHADRLKRSNVQRGDVICTHAGSIGQVAYIPETSRYERYIISQRQFYMRCNRSLVSPFYITSYFKTPEGQHRLLANTSSTGVPSISQPVTYLRQLKMLIPPSDLLKIFDETVNRIDLKIADNLHQSRTLATLRDSLLPKLLSGELTAPGKIRCQ